MHPESQVAFWYAAGRVAGALRPRRGTTSPWPERSTEPGISVVIPSRNGKHLLAAQMPGIVRELESFPAEIIVVDNGSDDGTAPWLRASWPQVRVETSSAPLSFARAVNRGIDRARCSHICLLNNDMLLEPGFFAALARAFDRVPDLFCATAQIFFPEGVRREETGKAVYWPEPGAFPIRCDEPFPGEDLTWVLYGSGGCSLYEAARLRALGGLDQAFEPAYVEDLDIGYRAWQRGWPTVYVAGAMLEHRHRATSSRYFTAEQLDRILEVNYLRFLARSVIGAGVFRGMWTQALDRLKLRAARSPAALGALREAWRIALRGGGATPVGASPPRRFGAPSSSSAWSEELIWALSNGAVAVFPGTAPLSRPRMLVAGPSPPAQPSTRGALLLAFTDRLATPPPEVLAASAAVVLVRRAAGPLALRAVLQQTVRRWRPEVATLPVDMVQYGADCAPARVTIS